MSWSLIWLRNTHKERAWGWGGQHNLISSPYINSLAKLLITVLACSPGSYFLFCSCRTEQWEQGWMVHWLVTQSLREFPHHNLSGWFVAVIFKQKAQEPVGSLAVSFHPLTPSTATLLAPTLCSSPLRWFMSHPPSAVSKLDRAEVIFIPNNFMVFT